jgi:hypothetical protein
MKNKLSGSWAASPSSQRREPTNGEVNGGFACGPADQQLFNELEFRRSQSEAELVNLLTYSGQTPDENDLDQVRKAIMQLAIKRTRVTFTSTGAFSWPIPANVRAVKISAWGGGGGGGHATNPSGASGGGSGAYFELNVVVTPGQNITGSVGAGGAAGTSGVNGGNGGNTTVTVNGTTYTAGGGFRGTNSAASTSQNSSSGGSVTGAVDIARVGFVSQGGQQGYTGAAILYYGGKGGSAPNGGDGGNGGTSQGNPGLEPGGGGAGAGANGSSNNGSAGARGEVWIEYAA